MVEIQSGNEKVKEIPLSQGKFALVDIEDYERVNRFTWHVDKKGKYASHVTTRKKPPRRKILLHRFVLNAEKGAIIDHINGDTFDNRKSNLRIVTNRQNHQNRHHPRTSKYPGVSWKKDRKKWQAQIQIGKDQIYLGSFKSEKEAFNAYKWACKMVEDGRSVLKKRKSKSSRFTGVAYHKVTDLWVAYRTINGIKHHIGCFEDENEAHEAYLNFCKERGV
jgi:hypothetical protein